jgi:hypothetical protein
LFSTESAILPKSFPKIAAAIEFGLPRAGTAEADNKQKIMTNKNSAAHALLPKLSPPSLEFPVTRGVTEGS